MYKLKNYYTETFLDRFNDISEEYFIDAKINAEDEEITVAIVNRDGYVTYKQEKAKEDMLVQELIMDKLIELAEKYPEKNIFINFLELNEEKDKELIVFRFLNNIIMMKDLKICYDITIIKDEDESLDFHYGQKGNLNEVLFDMFANLKVLYTNTEKEKEVVLA